MRRWLSGLLCAASLVTLSTQAEAQPHMRTPTVAAALIEQHVRMGQSVGSPTDGHLIGGSRLGDAPYLRFLPAYASEDARWGLGSLVAMIDRSARAVRRQFPDAVLSIGHLSRRGGGDIDRHASHESGRDADLSFYIRGQNSHPLYSDHMVAFRGDGTAPSWPGAFFDDAKNWSLVASIVEDPTVRVTYIFVAAPLRARLLAYAARISAPPAVRNRAAELMVQPRGSLPHDDHFHVRIGCPTGMTACIELPTHKHLMARHMGPSASSRMVASAKPPAHPAPRTSTHASEPALPPEAPKTAVPADDAPPPPTNAAVLVTPFDDVDGLMKPPPMHHTDTE